MRFRDQRALDRKDINESALGEMLKTFSEETLPFPNLGTAFSFVYTLVGGRKKPHVYKLTEDAGLFLSGLLRSLFLFGRGHGGLEREKARLEPLFRALERS